MSLKSNKVEIVRLQYKTIDEYIITDIILL